MNPEIKMITKEMMPKIFGIAMIQMGGEGVSWVRLRIKSGTPQSKISKTLKKFWGGDWPSLDESLSHSRLAF